MPQPLQLAPQVDEDDPPRAHGQGPEAALHPQGRPRDRPQELLPLHAQGYAAPSCQAHRWLQCSTYSAASLALYRVLLPLLNPPTPPAFPSLPAGQELPITDEFRAKFEEVYKEIAGQGERVLGFARLYLPLDK